MKRLLNLSSMITKPSLLLGACLVAALALPPACGDDDNGSDPDGGTGDYVCDPVGDNPEVGDCDEVR